MTRKDRGIDGLWTVKKTNISFHSPPHDPWKSHAARFPPSRSPTRDRHHGKVEIQKQDSHSPKAITLSQNSEPKGDQSRPDTQGFRFISGLETLVPPTLIRFAVKES